MSNSSLSETFANLAAPPETRRINPELLTARTSPRFVMSSPEVQQTYSHVLPTLHEAAGLPDQLPIGLLTRADLEKIYDKPLPSSYSEMTNLQERTELAEALMAHYKDQGINIKKTDNSMKTIERVLEDVLNGEATSQMPTVDIPMCIISFDANDGKLLVKDSFLGVAGISDPENRIKIDPARIEKNFTLTHEAAHCHQTGFEHPDQSFQAEREADLTAHKANPAEAELFYRARLINGIHKTAIRTLLYNDDAEILDHSTEVDMIDPKKFPLVTSQHLSSAYREIGTALTQERILAGDYDSPLIRQGLPAPLERSLRDTKDIALKAQLGTLQNQLKTSDKPFSALYKEALSYNYATPSPLKDALIYLALSADDKTPFLEQNAETTLADTAPLVATLLSKPDVDRLSPLAQDLLTLYSNAVADVQPDLERYRTPLPAHTRNPFTADISAFMIQPPPPTNMAHTSAQRPAGKKQASQKAPSAP